MKEIVKKIKELQMNKEIENNVELRKEWLKTLEYLNEDIFISKEEEILIFLYLLLNSSIYLSDILNYRNLTVSDIITNIKNDFDSFISDRVEQGLKESNKDLLHRITELEEELDVLYDERLKTMLS